jgi:integrase
LAGAASDPDWVYKEFVRLVRQARIRELPLHHLRHGSASLQLAAGVDIAIVSKRLGHSKINLTSDTYGHLIGRTASRPPRQVPRWCPGAGPPETRSLAFP